LLFCLSVGTLCLVPPVAAQSFRRGGTEFQAQREVVVPSDKGIAVAVVEFLHHGAIAADARNVGVVSRNQQFVPCRVLQLGPGDFCRLAFQPLPLQPVYQVLYGGPPVVPGTVPAWTSREGLLLETRAYRPCDLNTPEAVRAAFEDAPPIGADYVDGILHACNPFSLVQDPFMSRYTGTLQIAAPTRYGFYLATQDCGFLFIDGRLVASAPGRHPPLRHARPKARVDVQLTAGPHAVEFYHVAAGAEAMMALLWEVNPGDAKSQSERLPAEVWNTARIAKLPVGPMSTQEARFVPDFTYRIEGDVPLPDSDLALVRVAFQDTSARALTTNARLMWEFGDGQVSEEPQPTHVYLRPGLYPVKLSVGRAPRVITTTNRIYVDRPLILQRRPQLDTLADYLPQIAKYAPAALDAVALRQLVAAYEAQAARLEAPPDPAEAEALARPRRRKAKLQELPPEAVRELPAESVAERRAEAQRQLAAAVEAGQTAFVGPSAAEGDEPLLALARRLGPLARERLGQSELAFKIWDGAVRRIQTPAARAECAVEAADIAVNDLGNLPAAKMFLDGAKTLLGEGGRGPLASAWARVWGDYCAATGAGPAAREAYDQAERLRATGKSLIAQNAWRGAHNRSAEEFLQAGLLDRAAAEIHAWQREFPGEKIDGQVTYMHARYWAARNKYEPAIALANQLLTVNADSPYADQILLLAAVCESQRGNAKAASATLHALLKDYPGSPLVPQAREALDRLAAGKPLERLDRKPRKRL
jgi:PKD repeat protein/predicted negative regulator of RcsB-dependent stress response